MHHQPIVPSTEAGSGELEDSEDSFSDHLGDKFYHHEAQLRDLYYLQVGWVLFLFVCWLVFFCCFIVVVFVQCFVVVVVVVFGGITDHLDNKFCDCEADL